MNLTSVWLADAASTADWVAAVGQAVGALGTAAGVYAALRVAARDRAEDRAALARRVSVRVIHSGGRRFVVHNRSDASIVDVELVLDDGRAPRAAVSDPGETHSWEEIPPNSRRETPVVEGCEPTVAFTDGAGRRWSRRPGSAPRAVRDQPR